jgi:hypothetical protein
MTTLEDLKSKVEPFKNTLVICDATLKIVLLVDVIDGGDDYYWVYDNRECLYHATCVGGWTPLRGFIDQKKYNRMVIQWNYNNINKAI